MEAISETEYVLLEDYSYTFNNTVITVKAGTISDLASVPKLFWNIIPRDGLASGPAFIHDYLYTNRNGLKFFGWNRATCDKVLLQALLDAGANKTKAYTMYYAVRTFGGFYGGFNW